MIGPDEVTTDLLRGTGPKPERAQRGVWVAAGTIDMGGVPTTVWTRRVDDGVLRAFVAREPSGWHLSIAHSRPLGDRHRRRYCNWDEIAEARYSLLPDDITVAMLLPPRGQYVAVHPTVFHLHEIPSET